MDTATPASKTASQASIKSINAHGQHAGVEMPTTLLGFVKVNLSPMTYLTTKTAQYTALALAVLPTLPSSETVATLSLSWMLPILLRNLLLTIAVYQGTHHFFYVVRRREGGDDLAKKMNPAWPSEAQHARDRFNSLCGTCWAALIECAALHLMSAPDDDPRDSALAAVGAALGRPLHFALCLYLAGIWSDYHFFFVHRGMHPWFAPTKMVARGDDDRRRRRVDPGRWLYRVAHSLHHKSHNPGPWSGLSMHWLEHVLYFSRAPTLAAAFACLPAAGARLPVAVFLCVHLRTMLSPAASHHGFEDWQGSKFHFLHHAHFECNYSTRPTDGMDYLLGTFRK